MILFLGYAIYKLRKHPRAIHKCPNCANSYVHRRTLSRHIKYECGNVLPNISCPYCPHKTRYNSSLKSHIQKKHKDMSFQNSNNLGFAEGIDLNN